MNGFSDVSQEVNTGQLKIPYNLQKEANIDSWGHNTWFKFFFNKETKMFRGIIESSVFDGDCDHSDMVDIWTYCEISAEAGKHDKVTKIAESGVTKFCSDWKDEDHGEKCRDAWGAEFLAFAKQCPENSWTKEADAQWKALLKAEREAAKKKRVEEKAKEEDEKKLGAEAKKSE